MSGWSIWICDTQTGNKKLQVEAIELPWGRLLNDGWDGQAKFQLAVGDGIPWHSLFITWSREIVLCRNDIPVYVGIMTYFDYDSSTQQMTVSHSDIRAILAKRYPFGLLGYWANAPLETIPGDLVCTNRTWRAIASTVMAAGLSGPFTTIYSLPIILPSQSEAGTEELELPNYNFVSVADALKTIQTLGCDIDFQPSWSAGGTLQWTMRTGTPTVPAIAGNEYEFNMSVDEPALTDVHEITDGTKQLTGQFTVGNGQEQDMVVGGIGLGLASTIPALDIVQNQKNAANAAQAAAYSQAALDAYSFATVSWTFGMQAGDEQAPVEGLLMGDTIKIWYDTGTDPWLPSETWNTVRLVGFSGDLSEAIAPIVQ